VDNLALSPTRKLDVPREHVTGICVPRIATAVRPAFIVPLTRVV
jgi:hypothetical protein